MGNAPNDFRSKTRAMLGDLRNNILQGTYTNKEFLPSENQLCQKYGVSRPSVRKVLAKLADEGLIQQIRGKGSALKPIRPANKTIRMFWYTPFYEYDLIESIVRQFNEANPDLQLILTPVDARMYVRSIFSGNESPDLIGINNHLFMQLIEERGQEALLPLDWIQPKYTPDYYLDFLPHFTWNDRLYAAPISFSPFVLVYNQTWFEKLELPFPDASSTWDYLLNAAIACTKRTNGVTERYGFALTTSIHRWGLFVMQNGGRLGVSGRLSPPDQYTFEAIRFFLSLMYEHQVTPVYSLGSSRMAEELFCREKVAMIMTSYNFAKQLDKAPFRWGIAKFPRGKLDLTLTVAAGLAVNPNSPMQEEAARVIEYFIQETVQAKIKREGCSIPVMKTVAESREFPHFNLAGDGYYAFEDTLQHVRTLTDLGLPMSKLYELERAMDIVWANLERVETVWDELFQTHRI